MINIDELKRLHRQGTGGRWTGVFASTFTDEAVISIDGKDKTYQVTPKDEDLICFLHNNCEEIIKALEGKGGKKDE